MTEQFTSAIAALQETMRQQEKEVRETKRVINRLCAQDGKPILYPDADQEDGGSVMLRRDFFYSLSLPNAIKKYLETRHASGLGPATVPEIMQALNAGGFQFGNKGASAAKMGVYVTLARNPDVFHRIRGVQDEVAAYGLTAWYPGTKDEDEEPKKPKGKGKRRGARSGKPSAQPKNQPGPEVSVEPPAKSAPVAKPGPASNGVQVPPKRKGVKGVTA